ncbi:MAG: hypothetical protein N2712_07200 [Brevinematales bacterium]|nr:hypothetical protein [Brevinematales bacterium]
MKYVVLVLVGLMMIVSACSQLVDGSLPGSGSVSELQGQIQNDVPQDGGSSGGSVPSNPGDSGSDGDNIPPGGSIVLH